MRSESGIKNRWELLESVLKEDVKSKFNAYGWCDCCDVKLSRSEYWSGWWNDCFNFVTIFPKTRRGVLVVENIRKKFTQHGYNVSNVINRGISIEYLTMTAEESDAKAKRNLLNGGRMSD